MSESLIAIKYVLENEGSFSDNPDDKGGPTKFGLSQKFLMNLKATNSNVFAQSYANKWKSIDRIREMTESEAIDIYQLHIWKPIYAEIECQYICNYYFDMVVNHGESSATKILQRSIWPLPLIYITANTKEDFSFPVNVVDDGILGEITMNSLKKINDYYSSNLNYILLVALMATRAQYYRCLAKQSGQEQFLKGWLRRAYRIV